MCFHIEKFASYALCCIEKTDDSLQHKNFTFKFKNLKGEYAFSKTAPGFSYTFLNIYPENLNADVNTVTNMSKCASNIVIT